MDKKLISFPPVLPERPKVLILGSMPSKISMEKQQYYGNPRNHFWPIMFRLFNEVESKNYEDKIVFVKKHHIALWDSIGACYRDGSLDANIKEEEPNDIPGLLKEYPSITLIACNGTKSYQTFNKNFDLEDRRNIVVAKLPSTSPIPGRYTKSFEEKVEAWQVVRKHSLS